MHRRRHFLLCACLLGLPAPGPSKELTGAYTPAASVCPSPEEARAKMTVPDGYEVRCFAHEPMVQNPVAMTWDHRGRLWVVEAYEYPMGSDHPATFGGAAADDYYHPMPKLAEAHPRDRVIILEDTNNDGTADRRTVFLEGLNLASAILCGDSGIYIGQQPHLLHFRDDDGDDRPDAWRVVLTGFGREDTHELLNSFCWGPDGWLYMTHGVFTKSKVRRPGQPENEGFKFDAGIGRARPMAQATSLSARGGVILPAPSAGGTAARPWEFEVFADGTSNPWGCDYDAAGNFFVSACVIDHFFHMAPGGIYVRQGGAPENPYGYEQLPSIVTFKHFRAAYAGVQIYQGGRYPKDTWGHAFIGNIHDNAIHEEVITPAGSTFKCEARRDFLRANDGWFRPVSTQTGPDGFLWIMDWCDKYPCYQNAKANPEGVDRDHGRIWRVMHQGGTRAHLSAASNARQSDADKSGRAPIGSRPTADLDIKSLSTDELVQTLQHPNNWMRRMARRMLVERDDRAKVGPVAELVKTRSDEDTFLRTEGLWTLGQFEPDDNLGAIMEYAANQPAQVLRVWAARFVGEQAAAGSFTEGAKVTLPAFLEKLAADKSPAVRMAVAVALRQFGARRLTTDGRSKDSVRPAWPDILEALVKTTAPENDSRLGFHIWQALEPGLSASPQFWSNWLAEIAPAAQPLSNILAQKATRRLSDTGAAKNVSLSLAFCDQVAGNDVLLAHALDGLVKSQESAVKKPTGDVPASLARWRAHANADIRKHAQTLAVLWGDEFAIEEMAAILLNNAKPEEERLAVLKSLRQVRNASVNKAVTSLLTSGTSSALAITAIRTTSDLGAEEFVGPLLLQAASTEFVIRAAALEALASRENWTHTMLAAIEEGRISSAGFPVPVRRQLATSKDKAIRDHAFRALGAWQESSEDIKSLIGQKKQACLTGEPNLANGKLLFQSTCMVCHEFHGGGQKVGPDLIGSGRSNLEALLANVIDPNQIIGNGYENITVTTNDGRTLAGRMVEDTPNHLKLVGAGGAVQTVARSDVASLTNTKQSLMPMGFGNLPDAAFRDLIWYVLAPPEEGPLTREKKELFIRGVEVAEPATKPKVTNWRAIDWESVSLWNPDWTVTAPDFERTPVKLADYYGRSNVLLLHPFPDKKTPASFERKLKIDDTHDTLSFAVAADDRGDWELRAKVNGEEIKRLAIDHTKPRWKEISLDLSNWIGQEVTIRLESHATDWVWEFAYWHGIEMR